MKIPLVVVVDVDSVVDVLSRGSQITRTEEQKKRLLPSLLLSLSIQARKWRLSLGANCIAADAVTPATAPYQKCGWCKSRIYVEYVVRKYDNNQEIKEMKSESTLLILHIQCSHPLSQSALLRFSDFGYLRDDDETDDDVDDGTVFMSCINAADTHASLNSVYSILSSVCVTKSFIDASIVGGINICKVSCCPLSD